METKEETEEREIKEKEIEKKATEVFLWLQGLKHVHRYRELSKMSRRWRSQVRRACRNRCQGPYYDHCTPTKTCCTCDSARVSNYLPCFAMNGFDDKVRHQHQQAKKGRNDAVLWSLAVEQNLPTSTSVLEGEALEFISSVGILCSVDSEYLERQQQRERRRTECAEWFPHYVCSASERLQQRKAKYAKWREVKATGPRWVEGCPGAHRRRGSFDEDGMWHTW